MLPGRLKLQLIAFLLLSGGVAGNILLMQPHARRGVGEGQVASLTLVDVGDTGSINGPGAEPERGTPQPAAAPASIPIRLEGADLTRAVQRELTVRGYETGGADGVAGIMTRAAIMGYEHDHGMALSGRPSQELLKRILLGDGAPLKSAGSAAASAEAREVIRTVETSLARLGYRPGRSDGRLSPETVRAIREFEVDQALPESGRISGPLVARLSRLMSERRVASGR
jgi:peptidoglycan hydrolase-like protein with peptidoglycan-binding domain